MIFGLLADAVLAIHFAFVLFAIFGAFAVFWRRWVAYFHLPYVIWAAAVNLVPFTCPLTPLENTLRIAAGQRGYDAGFIDHYLTPLVYPDGMSAPVALVAGVSVVVWNALAYGFIYVRCRRSTQSGRASSS